jgi:tRNA(fMet)-specific endonuclease VapC
MLGTDIASYAIRGRYPHIDARLRQLAPASVLLSAISQGELLYGLKKLAPTHRLHVVVRQFLKVVRVLAWDADAADFYAEIRHQLTTQGQSIGELDMMIAAHSLAAGAVLVTNNVRHFDRINLPLVLEKWTDVR